MYPANTNPFGQLPCIVDKQVERFRTESGQIVELRRVKTKVFENGTWRIEEYFEVDPPLADNRIPSSINEIRECCVCRQLYHQDNCRECTECGRYYCYLFDCRGEIKNKDGIEVIVCASCAETANKPLISKLWSKLWSLGD